MISLNMQAPEKPVYSDPGSLLDVHSIFPTIQGEGPLCGVPAVFIRMAGCNLQCPACDTEYTQGRYQKTAKELVHDVLMIRRDTRFNLAVITGGEPLRQSNILELIEGLIQVNLYVQIETNGTLPFNDRHYSYNRVRSAIREPDAWVSIVCSPKAGSIHPYLIAMKPTYKYVLSADHIDRKDGLPSKALGGVRPARPWEIDQLLHIPPSTIFLNPEDTQDPDLTQRNVQACVTSCKKFGYRMGFQLHKIINLP